MFKLCAEILREPSFPVNEFEQLRQETLAQIEQQRSDPQSMALTTFQRHLNPYAKGDVRYVQTPDEDVAEIKATTLEAVKKFYTNFYGASKGELAVVGDFDDKELARLANELFGNWKNPHPFTRDRKSVV